MNGIDNKNIENSFVKFWIEDGILFNEFKIPTDLNIENCKEIIKLRHEICQGDFYYWCTSFLNIKSMPKEGRDYTDKYGQNFLYASAGLVESAIQAFIVNIFIKLKNPKIPFKAFTSKEDAVNWLKELKAKNGH
jgi:hypothetical protein